MSGSAPLAAAPSVGLVSHDTPAERGKAGNARAQNPRGDVKYMRTVGKTRLALHVALPFLMYRSQLSGNLQ